MKYVNHPVPKKDAMALVTGKPVYTDDLAPKDCLVVKLLRSPHPNAWVREIRTEAAKKVEGIVCVLTYQDVPDQRFTIAGQTYPELSPYDRKILDVHLRFAGDPVAIVAGETEAAVDQALAKVKVIYQVEKAVLDMHQAKDNPVLVHPEEDWEAKVPVGADNKRNLAASGDEINGDVDAVFADCAYVVDETYHTKANQQCMMETFRTCCYMDCYGRLNVLTSTQIPFHVRRIVGRALGIPSSKVRVIKPRIGGGFGAKQTAVCEVYPALVTWITGRPSKIVYSRYESLICASPRHEMEVRVKAGADQEGIVKALDIKVLSNTGAYGDHGPTTVGLTGHKALALYRHLQAYHFSYDVVYTNVQASGAYRGYGATQGIFAVESAINELAHQMGMDPVVLREKNMPVEGGPLHGYDGNSPTATSCSLDRCLKRAKEMFHWDERYPSRVMPNGKIRGAGMALALQGSSIACVDVGGATVKLNEDGSYTLSLGCADMGTGCDTILSQMTADCMDTELDNVVVGAVDTDISPYDSGSYASATTYATGNAVLKACSMLREKIQAFGAGMLELPVEDTTFDGICVTGQGRQVSLTEIAVQATCGNVQELQATASFSSMISPPPYMAGLAEVEIDPETGSVEVTDYVAVVDCGTPVNPNLARVQTEGGIVQGIGMALTEEVQYTDTGRIRNNSFMQYKIPSRMDVGQIRVEFESSYEQSGPFGAKSIGELVIDTPCPAIADAVYNAVGVRIRELPITPEKIAMGIAKGRQEV